MNEHHDESADDFLGALLVDDVPETDDALASQEPLSFSDELVYKSRKPKWWVQLSRKATKAQRRAMVEMEKYRLMKPPYGELIEWRRAFSIQKDDPVDVWLEIGFGAGENLLRLAEQYHDTPKRFVGIEIHSSGVGKVFQRMKEGADEKRFWKDYMLYSPQIDLACASSQSNHINERANASKDDSGDEECLQVENPYSNLRIYSGDAVKLLPYIPSESVSAVLITNPDPFPKQDEEEWRLIQPNTVYGFRRLLRPGGRLYLATDHEGFFSWSLGVLELVNERERIFRLLDPCPDRKEWLPVVSKYELKGWEEGRRPLLACWEAI